MKLEWDTFALLFAGGFSKVKGRVTGTGLASPIPATGGLAHARRSLRLGGPIFVESDDPAVLAQAHRALGYRAAYAPAVKLTDKARMESIVKEFADRDVVISEVGAWVNMLDPDPEKRRKNMAYVQERLALADELGALCCVDIAGSYDPKVWCGPNPKNLSEEFIAAPFVEQEVGVVVEAHPIFEQVENGAGPAAAFIAVDDVEA